MVSNALRRAIQSRRPDGRRLLHHSDRGCQYTSDAYQHTLRTLGITCSMSRTGCCYDNAVAERFFWSLKHEWTNHASYADIQEAELAVFKYIETFYDPRRIHQALDYKSPDQYEADHAPAQAAQTNPTPESASPGQSHGISRASVALRTRELPGGGPQGYNPKNDRPDDHP